MSFSASAQTVIDIESNPRSSSPADFRVATDLYFSAGTPVRTLWRYQSNSEPTVLQESPVDPFILGVLDGQLLFGGYTPSLGYELYTLQGSAATLVADINPGSGSSLSDVFSESVTHNGYLYFSADDGTTGWELYRTDGTEVEFVGDMNQGFDGSGNRSSFPHELFATEDYVFFSATNRTYGTELFRTDGTFPIRFDVLEGDSSFPADLVEHNGFVHFAAEGDSVGRELLRVGFSGPELAQDIRPGPESSSPAHLTELEEVTVFFANDGLTGHEPWVLRDGVATQLDDIRPGSLPSIVYGTPEAERPVVQGGWVFFVADDGSSGRELWRTDGLTVDQVADINVGANGSHPSSFLPDGDRLYFRADAGSGQMLFVLENGVVTELASTLDPQVIFDGIVFGPEVESPYGTELAWFDGSGQTSLDLVEGTEDSNPGELVSVGDKLLLAANRRGNNRAMYFLDGSQILRVQGTDYSDPARFAASSETVYFTAVDSVHGRELWRSSALVAEIVSDIIPGPASSDPQELTMLGDVAFLTAVDPVFGREVFVSDSTGLRRLADIFPGSGDLEYHAPRYLTAFNERLYFSQHDGLRRALYVTDGTAIEAIQSEVRNGPKNARDFLVAGGQMFFVARSDDAGEELWATDGSLTANVADIAPGLDSSVPQALAAIDADLYFSADDGETGRELWRVLGNVTSRVSDINPVGSSNPWSVVSLADTVYFFASEDGSNSQSLFRLFNDDVTKLVEIDGEPSSEIVPFDGSLFFIAEDADHGSEVWRIGSRGNVEVLDVIPGPPGSNPQELLVHDNRLYFVALSTEFGRELHFLAAATDTHVAPVTTGVDQEDAIADVSVFPNPAATESVSVSFLLAKANEVGVAVFDLLGRRVRVLSNERMSSGKHTIPVSTAGLPAGHYFVVVQTTASRSVDRLVVTR